MHSTIQLLMELSSFEAKLLVTQSWNGYGVGAGPLRHGSPKNVRQDPKMNLHSDLRLLQSGSASQEVFDQQPTGQCSQRNHWWRLPHLAQGAPGNA